MMGNTIIFIASFLDVVTSIARVMMGGDFIMENATTSLTGGNMTNSTTENEAELNSTRDQVTC